MCGFYGMYIVGHVLKLRVLLALSNDKQITVDVHAKRLRRTSIEVITILLTIKLVEESFAGLCGLRLAMEDVHGN